MSELAPLARPVALSTIGAGRMFQKIEATADERADLAKALELVDVVAFTAEIALHRESRGTIHLDGRIWADVVQNCVVSLEPVHQIVDEPIELRFVEDGSRAGKSTEAANKEIDVDPEQEDPPEVVIGTVLDLGPIVVEHLVLAIDPYPRAPGAQPPENPLEDTADASDSPFAVLGKLSGKRDDKH